MKSREEERVDHQVVGPMMENLHVRKEQGKG